MSDPLAPLVGALRDTAGWLDDRGSGVIIGGVAVALLGRPRATRDVDCILIAPGDEWQELIDSAVPFRIRPRIDNALEFARESRMLLLRHEPSAVEIDAMLGAVTFEEELVARAERIEVAGVSVPVASADDLIVMKAIAGRPRDLADIEGLLDAQRIDVERVRDDVRRFAELLDEPEIVNRLDRILDAR